MPALLDLLDDLRAERRQVIGVAARHEPVVDNHFLVDQLPPALRMSVLRLGHDVIVRSRRTSASTSVHGPWQITPIGLPASTKARTKPTASSSARRKSGLATPPGRTSAA